jgi:hypothetical protein
LNKHKKLTKIQRNSEAGLRKLKWFLFPATFIGFELSALECIMESKVIVATARLEMSDLFKRSLPGAAQTKCMT